jgi:hypothetical protein
MFLCGLLASLMELPYRRLAWSDPSCLPLALPLVLLRVILYSYFHLLCLCCAGDAG